MTTLFVSDVHLSAARPKIVIRFVEFLQLQARHADALYILGDLFDEWLGDDDDRSPHPQIIDALSDLASGGTPVHVMRGNHDFLLGAKFESQSNCSLLDDEVVINLYGTRTLLMHGDSLCTRDLEYQAFRSFTRDPTNQDQFLSLPLSARAERATDIRGRSKASMKLKTDDIMDVTHSAVIEAMRIHGVTHFVHGHTHRPAIHDLDLDGKVGKRIVLGDWYEQDSVLHWAKEGFRLGRFRDLAD